MDRLFFAILMLFVSSLYAQSPTRSLSEVRTMAVASSPKMKAAEIAILKSRLATKSSVVFDNPILKMESPTGTFYTLGVEQNFSLPTVYRNRKKLNGMIEKQVENDQLLSKAEVIYNTSLLYLDVQYQNSLANILKIKSSILDSISKSTKKAFEAGEIDFINVKETEIIIDNVALEILNNSSEGRVSYAQLKYLTGSSDEIIPEELVKYDNLIIAITDNGTTIFDKQNTNNLDAAQQELKIAKLQTLPGFNVGYMNQAEKNSDFKYRFGLGLTMPIWFRQNKAMQSTAKANIDYIASTNEALTQERKMQVSMLKTKMIGTSQKIDYINQVSLKNLEELEVLSSRMYEAGQTTMLIHLNNLIKKYDVRQEQLNYIKDYNTMVLELEYLNTR